MTTTDPIRAWHESRSEPRKPLAKAPAEDTQDAPPVEFLTAGSQPSGYEPPTLDDRFREWARESSYGRAPEYPPAA